MKPKFPFDAAIFDLDGTLLDSMYVWKRVDEIFFENMGMECPADYGPALAGKSYRESAEYTIERFGLTESWEEIVRGWTELAHREYAENVGLKPGAREYLTLLRRSGDEVSADAGETAFGDLKLQQSTFLLRCGDREVRLSRREYDLMELLMKNGSQIVTKEQLILKVWGYDSAAEDNNVEVYISFLRRKLTHLQSRVRIKTLRLVGYCLEVEE